MIRASATLFRLKLSLLNGISALAGYLLFPGYGDFLSALAAFVGVSLLAAGGSALNQVQERDLDARMLRTRLRPVPQRVLTRSGAFAAGVSTLLLGFTLLGYVGSAVTALLGVAALVWYLAVYTPLKIRTVLALPIGALCGAFPPLIGWSLAGGHPGDYRVITLAGLLFLWQVPHFWLFQRRHAEDYRRAGIPLFPTEGAIAGNSPFFWLWIAALCAGAMLLPAFGLIIRPGALWYALFPVPLIFFSLFRSGQLLFPCINCFPLLVTLLLVIQKQS
ncbi:MAG TPA: protoheme IX farnesyltransferase [Desulfuromonadales bacterium]|nr:protoheme IX farnesyltransferase [Desulfuromonadales bacterium]